MKKLFYLLLMLILSINIFAIPANNTPVTIKQSNGKLLTLYIKGDERINWATTIDGYTVIRNNNGDFVYGKLDEQGNLLTSDILASNPDERDANELNFIKTLPFDLRYSNLQINKELKKSYYPVPKRTFPRQGKPKLLVILAEFENKKFTYSKEEFENLFYEKNYKGFGSVKDYFYDNSDGLLDLDITVVGPVTIEETNNYYANTNGVMTLSAALCAPDVITKANDLVDYSIYDNDEDYYVENVFIIFAGAPRASTLNPDDIWPQAGDFPTNVILDERKFIKYACSTEKDKYGAFDGIGTICHEFGHILGLPDWYDTDYDASGGESIDLGNWSLMSGGNYNNNSKTPPYLSGLDKHIIGWKEPILLNSEANNCIVNSLADTGQTYKVEIGGTNSEFLIIEHRIKKKWDKYIPSNGLLIYHGDSLMISNWIYRGQNNVNVNPNNRGLYIEPASGNINDSENSRAPFPGSTGNTYFTNESNPKSTLKNGTLTNKPITNIKYINDSTITFNFLSKIPQAKTLSHKNVKGTSAELSGSIIYMGDNDIQEKGFIWHTDINKVNELEGNKVVMTSNDTLIDGLVTGLPTSTKIYYSAFVSNSTILSLSNINVLQTLDGLPTLTSINASDINDFGATVGANIINYGDDAVITEKGFLLSNDYTIPTDQWQKFETNTEDGNKFYYTFTGLSQQTTYYYIPYVTNSFGTKYATRRTFTTTFPAILNNTISENQTICTGITPETINGEVATGGNGNFKYLWQQKANEGTWENTSTPNEQSFSPSSLTETTLYRRIAISDNALYDTSNVVTITIKKSVGGTLTSAHNDIAKGTSTGIITLNNYTGTIMDWEKAFENESFTSLSITENNFEETLENLGTYKYRVLVKLDDCPYEYSSIREILVSEYSLNDIDNVNIDINIYPNPNNGLFTITSKQNKSADIKIINTLGQTIYLEKNTNISNKSINLGDIQGGNYVIIISVDGKQVKKSIIIK